MTHLGISIGYIDSNLKLIASIVVRIAIIAILAFIDYSLISTKYRILGLKLRL